MAIFRTVHNKNYTTVNNFICKDNRLSWKAKGIWLYAFSRPDDWLFYMKDLEKHATDGKDSLRSGLDELQKFGYLVKNQQRNPDGSFSNMEWNFFETPHEVKECLPEADFPTAANQESDNPPLLSTECLLSTEKKQQQAAPAAAVFFDCLRDLDIPESEKEWLSLKYSEDEVKNAIAWTKTQTEIKSLAASLKWACKTKPSIAKKSLSFFEELSLHFKNGEYYNDAECILNSDVISFIRGMKQDWIKLEFFNWNKFNDLCKLFGIKFSRELGLT